MEHETLPALAEEEGKLRARVLEVERERAAAGQRMVDLANAGLRERGSAAGSPSQLRERVLNPQPWESWPLGLRRVLDDIQQATGCDGPRLKVDGFSLELQVLQWPGRMRPGAEGAVAAICAAWANDVQARRAAARGPVPLVGRPVAVQSA